MADYIYLLDSRLSSAQKNALLAVREIARTKGLTVFLVGGAVRDLTSGSPVRDLDVVVQGNALKLRKDMEKAGAVLTGEMESGQALHLRFPGGVRMEVGSTLSASYPKPGKPVLKSATILDDLRRRDFTANAMALSLNPGSYGLLMDPLNGVADIENRELRLVSNYGFIEDPIRMVRAARYAARLGWQLEEKTLARYETGKAEGYISSLQEYARGYETEEIVHEEDPLRVLRRLEQEGWMKILAPAWNAAKANVPELEKLREAQMQLQMQGIHADASSAQFPLLTAKMSPKELAALKKSFARPGFVEEIEALEADAKKFAADLASKAAAAPSVAWTMMMAARPEAVLWVAYSTKSAALQAKFKAFYTEWPQARLKIPYTLMQEMRIVPELAGFDELVEKLVLQLMDGKLGTVEEMKAYLEPFSPPAPPPPVHLRRARAAKKVAKSKKKPEAAETLDGPVPEPMEVPGATNPTVVPERSAAAVVATPAKVAVRKVPVPKPAVDLKPAPEPAKPTPPTKPAPAVKGAPSAPAKKVAARAVVKTVVKAAAKSPVKAAAKPLVKATAKVAAKAVGKSAGARQAVKPAGKSIPVTAAVKQRSTTAKGAVKKTAPAKAVATKAAKTAVKKAVAKTAPAKASVKKVAEKAAAAKAKPIVKLLPRKPTKAATKKKR